MKQLRNDNKGAALVYILITVVVAGILTTGLLMLIVNRVRLQQVDEQKTKEYYLADGVVELLKNGQGAQLQIFLGDQSLIQDVTELAKPAPGSSEELTVEAVIQAKELEKAHNDNLNYLYYIYHDNFRCEIAYYGKTYVTIIDCLWDLKGNDKQNETVIQTYEVSQTPRTPAEDAGGEQPGGEGGVPS